MRGQVTGTSHSDSHPLLWMTEGRSVSAKFDRMTWRSEWMPRLEKFSENALKGSSSQNWIWKGEGSEDKESLKRRGSRAGVDLRLGAINTTNVNRRRGRERKDNHKSPKQHQIYQVYWKESTYAWKMHEYVTCKTNCIIGSAQSKPISTQTGSTHLNAWQYYYNANVMQCMRFETHLSENPSQNFNNNSSILKNPKT